MSTGIGADRIAVVTGASAGIGRATAREFARRGYGLALLARGTAGLNAVLEESLDAGVPAVAVPTDVSDPQALRSAADRIEAELGPVDVWVNCGFASIIAPFTDVEPEEFRRVTDVSFHGYVEGTRVALDRMLPRDSGTIVQVGSALGYRGIPFQSAYCAARHAVRGFTDSLRAELVERGSRVRLTEVHLPGVNTPQFSWVRSRIGGRPRPVPPVYQPEVCARAIVWAAEHPRRRRYWVGASTVGTILGQRLAPRVLDYQLGRSGRSEQARDAPAPVAGNLFQAMDEQRDYGAHGEFDDESYERSIQQELNQRRAALAAGASVAAGTVFLLWRGLRRRFVPHA